MRQRRRSRALSYEDQGDEDQGDEHKRDERVEPMMKVLASLLSQRRVAWAVVLVVLLMAGTSTFLAMQVTQDDNLLAFLPGDDPDVRHFQKLAASFGGLEVALVGLDSGSANGVFTHDFLSRLKKLTADLMGMRGLDGVTSLDNVADFVANEEKGGIVTGPLIRALPRNDAELQALRSRVLARDHVVGNFVSSDGRAALIYCFLAQGSDPRPTASRIRRVVEQYFDGRVKPYYGGGPFISSYIFETIRRDMRQLTPWAVLAMVIVMLISFRDWVGTCLALLSTSFGIVFSIGLMAAFGEPLNLVLSSMPVILFAVGSAYGIHILARYYDCARDPVGGGSSEERRATAIAATLQSVGPTVLAAGLTTAVSLLSFLVMDQRPMRVFGLFTGIGVLMTLLLSVTFVPAVLRLTPLRGKVTKSRIADHLVLPFVRGIQEHRLLAGIVLVTMVVAAGVAVTRVENRIDSTNLFAPGSAPHRADRFLSRHFGGSQFLLMHFKGDMNDPLVLRELTSAADRLGQLPHVSSVMHIADIIARANEAMEGPRRVPDSVAKVRTLHAFISAEAGVRQLVTADREEALMQVKLDTSDARELERVLEGVEGWLKAYAGSFRVVSAESVAGRARLRELTRERMLVALQGAGVTLDKAQTVALDVAFAQAAPTLDEQAVEGRLWRFMRTEECAARLPPPDDEGDPVLALARRLVSLGSPSEQVAEAWQERAVVHIAKTLKVAPDAEQVEDVLLSVQAPLTQIFADERARQHGHAVLKAAGVTFTSTQKARGEKLVAAAMLDLTRPQVLLQGEVVGGVGRSLHGRVNGLPVLHRALSRSALKNQIRSLVAALVPVILIMIVLFRSLRVGLIVAAPTFVTLLLIYGGMGIGGVRLDLGTAMLACIILGAGVDYGVHFVATWRGEDAKSGACAAVKRSGGAIWTNALTVCLGFFVLTMGEARPLQNVGGLTALAMLVAAVATFWTVPLLARRGSYRELAPNEVNEPVNELVPLNDLVPLGVVGEGQDKEAVVQATPSGGRE
ncbi:MAG: MMPL family transporter [Deltaproteobacteria bacterium]|nr:MMPL family transporter [Deltaproteobacteria bacterium]